MLHALLIIGLTAVALLFVAVFANRFTKKTCPCDKCTSWRSARRKA